MSFVRIVLAVSSGALLVMVIAEAAWGQTGALPMLGDGTLVAAPGSPYITGSRSYVVASGDFNGDGLADLAVTASNQNSTLTILLATGGGAFVPAAGSPISVGSFNNFLAIADFNGDGILDIASGGVDIEILLGDGRGGFSPISTIQPTSLGVTAVGGLATGDFNHDGKADLVALCDTATGDNYAGCVAVLLGDGLGNFIPASVSPLQVAQVPSNVTVADFNLDGNLDIAATSAFTNQVAIMLGDGRGRLSPGQQIAFPAGTSPTAIVHGDFNGDGNADLAVGNWFAGSLTILLGDGSGGFTALPDINLGYGWTPQWLAVGDLDGDGILDLAAAVSNDPISNVVVLIGDGKGGFSVPAGGIVADPGGAFGITLGDFNGDGRLDVATANVEAGTTSVFLGAPASSSVQLNLLPPANPTLGVPCSLGAFSLSTGWRQATGAMTLMEGSVVLSTQSMELGAATLQTTFQSAGLHTLTAVYSGDLRTSGSTSPPLIVNVAKGSQAIAFPTLPNHTFGDPPFPVSASSSSGLPVTLRVISGPATFAGNVLTLTGAGVVTLQASQPGDANYLPAPNVEQQLQVAPALLRIDSVVNAASYKAEALAPGSYGVVFGASLASVAAAAGPLTPMLGGTRIQVSDASGKSGSALIYFASPAQINFILPANLSPGTGTMTVQTQAGPSATAPISIAAVDPGLFSANASGTGVAAGGALRVSADGTQTQLPIAHCSGTPLVCTAVPIDLGTSSDVVYLSLYGTGIRGRTALSAITAMIGGIATKVTYAGAQPNYPGLDQVNLQLNPALAGRGKVEIALGINGTFANVVNVVIQ